MKSQDILLILKLVSLQKMEQVEVERDLKIGSILATIEDYGFSQGWEGWEPDEISEEEWFYRIKDRYSLRNLSAMTGISKSEIGNSLARLLAVGLVTPERKTSFPRANKRALQLFIQHGLRYVFPAERGELTRGIPTSFAAPVMSGKLMSAGENFFVWPDTNGKEVGTSIQPLYKSVPLAVKRDPKVYELLALIDAIRLGNAREINLAVEMLEEALR